MENFKLLLDYYDEDGNRSKKETLITVNGLKDITEKPFMGETPHKTFDMTFSLKIPNHIHSYMLDKSVPIYGVGSNNSMKTYEVKTFKKTITSSNITTICKHYNDVLADYKWLKNMEKLELTKVIFYQFNNQSGDFKSSWNGNKYGVKSSLGFLFCVGYISVSANGRENRFNSDKRLVNAGSERDFYNLKHVSHTEERELFFENIQRSFVGIIERIDQFESSLSEDSINTIIQGGALLLT